MGLKSRWDRVALLERCNQNNIIVVHNVLTIRPSSDVVLNSDMGAIFTQAGAKFKG